MKHSRKFAATLAGFAMLAASTAYPQAVQYRAADNLNNVPVSAATPLPVTGSFSASTSCTSTAAAPTYSEGSTSSALSCDLSGNLRTSGGASGGGAVTNAGTFAVQNTAATPAGSNNIGSITNITGTVSLPTGAATSSAQTTAQTSLTAIATNTALGVGATGSAVPASASYTGFKSGSNLVGVQASAPLPITSYDSHGTQMDFTTPSPVNVQAATTGGCTPYSAYISSAGTNATLVSTGVHTVCWFTAYSTSTTAAYLKVYDASGTPTAGSGTPVQRYAVVPAAASGGVGGAIQTFPISGMAIASGLGFTMTGGQADNDTTSATTGIYINIGYK